MQILDYANTFSVNYFAIQKQILKFYYVWIHSSMKFKFHIE